MIRSDFGPYRVENPNGSWFAAWVTSAHRQPGQKERSCRAAHGGHAVNADAAGGLCRGPVLGHLVFRAACSRTRLLDRGARLAAQVLGHLRGAVLGACLHVRLGRECLHGLAEFLPGPLDVRRDGLGALWRGAAARGVLVHRWALSLICSTSAFTLSAARPG